MRKHMMLIFIAAVIVIGLLWTPVSVSALENNKKLQAVEIDGYNLDVELLYEDGLEGNVEGDCVSDGSISVEHIDRIKDAPVQTVVMDAVSDIRAPQYMYAFSVQYGEKTETVEEGVQENQSVEVDELGNINEAQEMRAHINLTLSEECEQFVEEIEDSKLWLFEIKDGKVREVEYSLDTVVKDTAVCNEDNYTEGTELGNEYTLSFESAVCDTCYVILIDAPSVECEEIEIPKSMLITPVNEEGSEYIEGEDEGEPQYIIEEIDGFVPGIENTYNPEQTQNDDSEGIEASAVSLSKYTNPDISSVPLKNQNPYGNCWAFTATALAETSYLKEKGTYRDMSEAGVVYSTCNSSADPLGNSTKDVTKAKSEYYNAGGSPITAAYTMATWQGLLAESSIPYSEKLSSTLAGVNPSITRNDVAHLEDYYLIDATNKSAVKEMIVENGSVGILYYDGDSYYNSSNNSYYCTKGGSVNHAITIVGWDDDFARSNFVSSPSGKGAWLVKNSWTSSASLKNSHYGYFWLSYYDKSIYGTAVSLHVNSADNYDYNYQYDGALGNGYLSGASDTLKIANIYKASGKNATEYVSAVGFFSSTSNTSYTVDVYTGVSGNTNPTNGTYASYATVSGKTTYSGYYTIELPKAVAVKADEKFAVVVTFTNANERPRVPLENSSAGSAYSSTAYKEEGQSFYLLGSSWKDIAKQNISSTCGNIRLKAYTKTSQSSSVDIVNVTFDTAGGYCGEEVRQIEKGAKIGELPSCTKKGATFIGWYDAKNGGNKVTSDYVCNSNVTFYARYEGNVLVVKFVDPYSCYTWFNIYLKHGSGYFKDASCTQPISAIDVSEQVSFGKKYGLRFEGYFAEYSGVGKRYIDGAGNILAGKEAFDENVSMYGYWVQNSNSEKEYDDAKADEKFYEEDIYEDAVDDEYEKTPTPTPAKVNYTIVFDKNGGTGSMKNLSVKAGKTVKLSANKFKKTGYTFVGWNTKKNGKGKSFKNKEKVSNLTSKKNAKVKLYAQWKANTYTVKFNAGGGKGKMSNVTVSYGKKKALPKNQFTKKGYKFAGWATSKKDAKNGKVKYKNKAKIKNLTTKNKKKVTLYAVWKKK